MKPVFAASSCTESSIVYPIGNSRRQMTFHVSGAILRVPRNNLLCFNQMSLRWGTTYTSKRSSSCFHVQRSLLASHSPKSVACRRSLTIRSIVSLRIYRSICSNWLTTFEKMKLRLLLPKQYKCNIVPFFWRQCSLCAVFGFVLFIFGSFSQLAYGKGLTRIGKRELYCHNASSDYSKRKPVMRDYSIIGIPGDGRCLFRSLVHGACIRSGKPAPSNAHQMQLADDLRFKVAEEFIKRRKETEWFIEGDFDRYVLQIRKPHVWGGEPELLMASHVLEMPITVYMYDEESSGLISIAEYRQEEYGEDDPIRVLFHGYGHYDAIQVPGNGRMRSRSRL